MSVKRGVSVGGSVTSTSLEVTQSPFDIGVQQLERAAAAMDLDPNVLEILRRPQRVLSVYFPVRMDSGSVRVFHGIRSQYNNALGPYKGGTRYHPDVTVEEVMALSMWMTWKCAIAGLPYGGGKGGVVVNPKALSRGELERLSRGYFSAIAEIVGPHRDIPAPDVYTDSQVMAWFMDEYSKISGHNAYGVVTGKPLIVGGSLGRDTATARGLSLVVGEAMKKLGFDLGTASVAVQGYGNAGSYSHMFLERMGATVVAVSDSKGGILSNDGLKYSDVSAHKRKTGSVRDFSGCDNITNRELLELDVDVLVPAALENQITGKNAGRIGARLVAEAANGPTTPEADDILGGRGVEVIPDVLANAGGVTTSYLEWVQNLQSYYWTASEVDARLRDVMTAAFDRVWRSKEENEVDMRTGAYIYAIKRVAEAMKVRGWV